MSYQDWTAALSGFFFSSDRDNTPVIFFVDDDVLGDILSSSAAEATASLTSAVKDRLLRESSGNVYRTIQGEQTRWRMSPGGDPPPSLPVLAVSVLAAAHMQRDDEAGVARTNYYYQLRELLDLGHDITGMPKGYDRAMRVFWSDYTWWLDEELAGGLGKSTVRSHPTLTNIGPALSQTLFRQSDRNRLSSLFDRLDLRPVAQWPQKTDPPITRNELVAQYRAWAGTTAGLTNGAIRLARNAKLEGLLGEVLWDSLESWDGRVRDSSGRLKGRLLIALRFMPRPTLGLVATRPEGFDDVICTQHSDIPELTSSVNGWYDSPIIDLDSDRLETGLRFSAAGSVFEFKPSPAIPLRPNQDLGCWASVRQLAPHEPHYVLVNKACEDHLVDFLRRHADSGEHYTDIVGWSLFRDVVIAKALDDEPHSCLRRLVPTVRLRPGFDGGLVIDAVRRIYLSGGDPDLWVPPELVARDSVISVDGEERWVVSRQGGKFKLGSLDLAAGAHTISIDPVANLSFVTMETRGVLTPDSAGSRAHLLRFEDDEIQWYARRVAATPSPLPINVVAVAGARIRGQPVEDELLNEPVVFRSNARRYFIVGAEPGQITTVDEPKAPGWLNRAGLDPGQFEATPPFPPVWVIHDWGPFLEAHCHQPLVPGTCVGEDKWAELFDPGEYDVRCDAPDLWAQYVEAAGWEQ